MYYLNSRYYDPNTGRFLNADGQFNPDTGLAGNNLFAYCNNNPINASDYNGARFTESDDGSGRWYYVSSSGQVFQGVTGNTSRSNSKPIPRVTGDISKNIATGSADAVIGRTIAKLPDIKTNPARVGPGVGVVVRESKEIVGVQALKSVSRYAGIIAMGSYFWDIGSDAAKYQGGNFYKAASVSSLALMEGIGVGLALGAVPVGVAIVVGAIAGTAIGYGEDYLKKQWIGY